MNLTSPIITLPKTSAEVFDLITTLENFKKLMPENLEKFESNSNNFSFSLKGMPEIKLVIKASNPNTSLVLTSASGKVNFDLTIAIQEITSNSTNVQFIFTGDINPMMAMMVKKPLENLINTFANNISLF